MCPNDDILSYFLPNSFKYKVIESKLFDDQNFECHVRIALTGIDDFKQWLHDFEEKTNTSWIVKKSHGCDDKTYYVVNRNYVCQHSSFRKRQKSVGSTKKDKSCEAAFTVRIKRNNSCIRYHDLHVKDGLTAVVKISFVHSHPINDADSRNWLRRSQETRDTFISYFKKGLTPIQAMKYHQDSLLSANPEQLSNSRKNPPRGWVYALHDKWIEEKPTEVPSNSTVPILILCNSTEPKHSSQNLNNDWDGPSTFRYVTNSNEANQVVCNSTESTVKYECAEPSVVECDTIGFLETDMKDCVFQDKHTNCKEILEKWDTEMLRLRTIFRDNIKDHYFRNRVEKFLNISSSVWTKDQMCALLEMGIL